ncbi:MAG: type II toxin-antitoxin system death-on-curing family toxin [Candidatus Magnetominusculus sp. LBB02]|nr:type II toxin-antitoxin system death-on-curing family toxin [Candidatus Magnetominusculus sp. LBB02]
MEIVFLELEEVIEIHQDQIKRYGGASDIRDMDLLQSAVSMPQTTYDGQYLHEDIFEMAGAYLFHIVKNHPFIDGNKRTGAVAAVIFLTLNEIEINADEESFEKIVRLVAEGMVGKADAARFFRENVVK